MIQAVSPVVAWAMRIFIDACQSRLYGEIKFAFQDGKCIHFEKTIKERPPVK